MKTPHIIYIHGLGSSGKIFNHLQSQLPKHKATLINYDSSRALENSFEDVLESIPVDEPFSIVSHSLGGIIGHLLATRTTPNVKIDHLVSISTPFGGSEAANKLKWFYPGYSILKDISTKSAIIKEIALTNVVKCPFLSIVSTGGHLPFMAAANDGVVTVESQLMSRPTRRVEVTSNHFEAVQDIHTIEEIKRFIF